MNQLPSQTYPFTSVSISAQSSGSAIGLTYSRIWKRIDWIDSGILRISG
ncbi:MAG TPA: hypothetical protein PLH30_05970 [Bacteroidales bacterium]|nr:hypothetical protein [Bacteroidales bacterium]